MCYGIAKLVFAPRNRIIFSSEALVASKAVLTVPNQTRAFFWRISNFCSVSFPWSLSNATTMNFRLRSRSFLRWSENIVLRQSSFSFGEGGISANSTSLNRCCYKKNLEKGKKIMVKYFCLENWKSDLFLFSFVTTLMARQILTREPGLPLSRLVLRAPIPTLSNKNRTPVKNDILTPSNKSPTP
jgi:hypothetical protein